MKLKFGYHAQYRLNQRQISIAKIKSVIASPEFSVADNDGIIKSWKTIAGEKICVIYKKQGSEYFVLTIYYKE